jgi:hypothetical protein
MKDIDIAVGVIYPGVVLNIYTHIYHLSKKTEKSDND